MWHTVQTCAKLSVQQICNSEQFFSLSTTEPNRSRGRLGALLSEMLALLSSSYLVTVRQKQKQLQQLEVPLSTTSLRKSSTMDENNWVPYAQRKEWADVTPLPQDDGDDPVVRIAYDKKCLLARHDFIYGIQPTLFVFFRHRRL